jgi:hypothetical protein
MRELVQLEVPLLGEPLSAELAGVVRRDPGLAVGEAATGDKASSFRDKIKGVIQGVSNIHGLPQVFLGPAMPHHVMLLLYAL